MTILWFTHKSRDSNYNAAVPGNHKTTLVIKFIFLLNFTLGDTAYLRYMKAIDLVFTVSLLPKYPVIQPQLLIIYLKSLFCIQTPFNIPYQATGSGFLTVLPIMTSILQLADGGAPALVTGGVSFALKSSDPSLLLYPIIRIKSH